MYSTSFLSFAAGCGIRSTLFAILDGDIKTVRIYDNYLNVPYYYFTLIISICALAPSTPSHIETTASIHKTQTTLRYNRAHQHKQQQATSCACGISTSDVLLLWLQQTDALVRARAAPGQAGTAEKIKIPKKKKEKGHFPLARKHPHMGTHPVMYPPTHRPTRPPRNNPRNVYYNTSTAVRKQQTDTLGSAPIPCPRNIFVGMFARGRVRHNLVSEWVSYFQEKRSCVASIVLGLQRLPVTAAGAKARDRGE